MLVCASGGARSTKIKLDRKVSLKLRNFESESQGRATSIQMRMRSAPET